MKKSVSILGCGWLGQALAVEFIQKGYHVKGSTTTETKLPTLKNLGIDPYLLDISNAELTRNFFDAEVLIIAITSKNLSDFERLVGCIENSSIQRVSFISSTSVYPNVNDEVTEEAELNDSPLVQIENIIQGSKAYQWHIIRFAGLLGYDRHPSNWFRNKFIPQPEGCVNMIHRDDCVNIIQKLIDVEIENEIFNACCNHHPSRRDFYTFAKLSRGMEPPTFIEETKPSWKKISSAKLQDFLNYEFIHDDLFQI